MTGINLKVELDKVEHGADRTSDKILQQIADIFAKDMFEENNVIRNLKNKQKTPEVIELTQFDSNRIYHLDSIQKLSIKYRLRFLHSSYYKQEFPQEAIFKIKELERKNDLHLSSFFLLAPKEVFELGDANADPLLFARLSDNTFYLIHHWGNDLHWSRALLNFPYRGIKEFLISTLLLAFLFQLCIPSSVMMIAPEKEMVFRLWLTTHCFIAFFSFFIFLGAISNKRFSNTEWRSKFFNE